MISLKSAKPWVVTSPRLEFDKIRWIPRMRIILCLLLPMMPTPAAAQVRSLLTRHVREVTINGQAQLVARLPATQSMNLDVVLPPKNQAALKTFLQQVYDASNPSYRHFLTVQQFTALFGPARRITTA